MEKVPFNTYDFFGYLASGLSLTAAIDYGFGGQIMFAQHTASVYEYALVILASYVTGHVIAHVSNVCLADIFTQKLLGIPFDVLLVKKGKPRLMRWLFPGYFKSLPEYTRQKIASQAARENITVEGEAFFLHVYERAIRVPYIAERLESYRNLYGFARSMSFTFLVCTLLLGLSPRLDNPVLYWIPVGAFFLSVGMLYRFLKFYRLFALELLRSYSEGTLHENKESRKC